MGSRDKTHRRLPGNVQIRAESRNIVHRTENMLTSQRKSHILTILARDGQVVAKRLSEDLGLSEDTIRRDLRELAAEGKLQRVHGGALPASPAMADYASRKHVEPAGKIAIGRAAAGLIRPGQVVFIDGGTTTLAMVEQLPATLRATIVTHSPSIAAALVEHPLLEIILIGGRLFKHSVVTVGAAAIEGIAHVRADSFFLGVTGLHAEVGLTTGDAEEAAVKRALMHASAETIVLASREKIGAASPYLIGPVHGVSTIVTEKSVPKSALAPYDRLGIGIVRA
jgi:DeoR/GlpR family transcriptional regulator of sugar metabolism